MGHFGLDTFVMRGRRTTASPERTVTAARGLIDGALRIRKGNDGVFVVGAQPVTKPTEAIGAWINGLAREAIGGRYKKHEMHEALVTAAEEVDKAAAAVPGATRLRNALFADALDVLGTENKPRVFWPWIVATALGGILAGILLRSHATPRHPW